jgi:hypothetical protein
VGDEAIPKRWLRRWPKDPITYEVLQELIKESPKDPRLRAMLGNSHAAKGEDEAACGVWAAAIELFGPRFPDAVAELRCHMGEALLRPGRKGLARRHFGWAARGFHRGGLTTRVPAYTADVTLRETDCLVMLGRFHEARGEFTEAPAERLSALESRMALV